MRTHALDHVVFHPIGDSGIRLLDRHAGQLDVLDELAPTDVEAVQPAANLRPQRATALGYATISLNIGHPPSQPGAGAGHPYWNPDRPVPPRDVAAAPALLRRAGLDRVPFASTVTNTPRELRRAAAIQSKAAEAGFDMTIRAHEVNAHIQVTNAGDDQASVVVWSGRADPDANVSLILACDGW